AARRRPGRERRQHGASRRADDAEGAHPCWCGGSARALRGRRSRVTRGRGRCGRVRGSHSNWLTWSDHYFPNQLQKVKGTTKIGGRVQLISDDSDAYIRVKRGGGQWDISSEDALWVPKFYKDGLIEAFDIKSIPVSKQLCPIALNIPFWKTGSNQMGYPFGWSSLQIYYNPKYVKTKPDSYHALIDNKYKKKIVVENQPTDLMAMAGIATGAKKPYNMTKAEISRAKQFL